jgi:molybdenum cofactor biosynthesis enzyme MoaA
MCYFSDEEKRKKMKGVFKEEDIYKIADAFFHRALKLQIGCGAEPSLFKHNTKIIELAKKKNVPYISLTTNANLFTEKDWYDFANAGLDEVTLSVHGTTKESYEYFMTNGSFDLFIKALETVTNLKKHYPNLKIRLNYTMNKDNLEELSSLFDVYGDYKIDIVQLRPIKDLGNTDYTNFSWSEIYDKYEEIIQKVKDECVKRGVTCIAPAKEDLMKSETGTRTVLESTFCYISPRSIWENDFDLQKDNFESYSKRTRYARKLFKNIFYSKKSRQENKSHLNYEVL